MRLIDSIKALFSRNSDATPAPVPVRQPSHPRLGLRPLWATLTTQPLQIATVYRCVNLLADSVANLRLQYMRKKGQVFVEDTNSRLHYLLTVQPNANMSAFDFWRQVVQYVLLNGNAYIVPVYNSVGMEIDSLELVDPTTVAHDAINNTYTINDINAGVSGVYTESQIVHIKNYTRDGKQGISTIAHAATVLDIASAGDSETLNRFVNGGTVRGIVSNDTTVRGFGEYQDAELDNLAQDLDTKLNSSGQNITAIHGSAKFDQTSMTSADMQFLESRKFTVRDICRFFGVHPSFVFDDTSNNYKSAEMANVAFLANTLNPLLRRIECELLRKLVAPSLCCKRRFEFDRRDLYACDLDSRVRYQTATIAAGIYTVNDWRRAENRDPVEGGDTVLVSANLKSLDELNAATTEPVEITTEPAEPTTETTEPDEE